MSENENKYSEYKFKSSNLVPIGFFHDPGVISIPIYKIEQMNRLTQRQEYEHNLFNAYILDGKFLYPIYIEDLQNDNFIDYFVLPLDDYEQMGLVELFEYEIPIEQKSNNRVGVEVLNREELEQPTKELDLDEILGLKKSYESYPKNKKRSKKSRRHRGSKHSKHSKRRSLKKKRSKRR